MTVVPGDRGEERAGHGDGVQGIEVRESQRDVVYPQVEIAPEGEEEHESEKAQTLGEALRIEVQVGILGDADVCGPDIGIGGGEQLRHREKEAGKGDEESDQDPAQRHGGAADQGTALQQEVEPQTEQERQSKDGAMHARMAEQEQGDPQANGTPPAVAQEDAGDDDQQQAQGIRTGDHPVLVKREVPEGEQGALQSGERREPGNEEDGRGGDDEVQRLHGHRGSRQPCEGHEQQVPQGGMALVLQVREQVRGVRAVTGQQPGLRLVLP